jgi:Protein of unknown function (DUF3303)
MNQLVQMCSSRGRPAERLLPVRACFLVQTDREALSWSGGEEWLGRCFQLMATDDARTLDEWTARWSDLAELEVVPVISSAEARARALDR